jgi:hypothetical protein
MMLALLVCASCQSSGSAAKCTQTELSVDISALPSAWRTHGSFVLCEESRCQTESAPFHVTPNYVNPLGPGIPRDQSKATAHDVSLRILVDGNVVRDLRSSTSFRADSLDHPEGSETCGGSVRLRISADGTALIPLPRH